MAELTKPNRLKIAMATLEISARDLSRMSGVDHSLIAKWAKGERPLSRRSKQLVVLAKALARFGAGRSELDDLTAPYRLRGETPEYAMWEYLLGEDIAGLPLRADASKRQTTGEYSVKYQVFLGKEGFGRVALANLDYLTTVPPGMELTALCQGRFDWILGDPAFGTQFFAALRKAVESGARFTIINRKCYPIEQASPFAGAWLLAHLRGHMRSLYCEGELPKGLRLAATIPGYLGTWVEEDPEVEDGLYAEMHTDLKTVWKAEKTVEQFKSAARPVSQYGFLRNLQGDSAHLWRTGPLPAWKGAAPRGNFSVLSRVPGIGIMTWEELREVSGGIPLPAIPDYLFSKNNLLTYGPHRIILCREDVMDGLRGARKMHPPLSQLLRRRVFVSRQMLANQLQRLLAHMAREEVEVALMPRVAFSKLEVECVCWQNSVSVAWLQDMGESVFVGDPSASGSLYGFLDHVWEEMLAGWKSRNKVTRQLRKWLSGKGLDQTEGDSAVVRNWDVLPASDNG